MASVPFNNLITFSRGSNATVTGPTGLVQWAPNNLLTFSEQFDNAAWGKVRITAAANTSVAPDGTTTADTLNGSGGGTTSISQTMPAVGGLHTATVYAKAGTKSVIQFSANAFAWGADARANFDIANGVLGTVDAGLTATITPIGDGWFRCAVTANKAATAGALLWCIVDSATAAREASATAGSIIFWGAQLELGSAATTYNSTTVKNLLGFSEAFDNAAWTKTRASIVTGAQANPVNGAFNAQKLMEDTVAGTHILSRSVTASASLYNYSIYAKAAERSVIRIRDSVNSVDGYFNLATGVASNAVNATLSIVAIGNGWYRCSVTSTATVTNPEFGVRLASAVGTDSYTGDGNSGVYIYGAQLSDSASLDPYVPTPAAAPSSTAYYGPRFDYDPVTLAPKGLLVEEARTNLVTYSQDFASATWAGTSATKTSTNNADPFGGSTALLLTADGTSAPHYIGSTAGGAISYTSGTTYTTSYFVKAGTATLIQITMPGGAFGTSQYANFQLTGSGSVTASTGGTAAITPSSNGYYRISWTAAATVTTTASTGLIVFITSGADGRVPTNSSAQNVYLAGAQLEAGAFATSYIPTVASTVTRSADVATINGSLFSQWYGQTQGTIVANCSYTALDTLVGICGADAGNGDNAQVLRGEPTNLRTLTRSAGVSTSSFVLSPGMNPAGSKAAYAYALNNCSAYANGLAATGTSGALPAVNLTQFTIGAEAFGTFLNGHIRSIDFIPARAADFQLQALTL